jgi:hypothetical protein
MTKGLDHPDADIASQQASQNGRGDKGDVDCKQLGASIRDGHDVDGVEAVDAQATKSPKIGTIVELEGAMLL